MFPKFLSAVFCLVFLAAQAGAGEFVGTGIKKLDVLDPIDQKPMDAVVFFPSVSQTEKRAIGPYEIAASKSATIADGSYPLILLSHGTMGSMWGHHGLATFLSRQGFIVVSVTHPGDNFQDPSRIGSTSGVYGRPQQISAALSAALKDPALEPHINAGKIGFVGFSAGGTTGLVLAGAQPLLSRLEDYCAKRPEDQHVCEAQGHIRNDRPELTPSSDPRIRAFVLLAPLSVVFTPETLTELTAPMLVFGGGKDEELSTDENAAALAKNKPSNTSLKLIPDAGHFTFLTPCTAALSSAAPPLCIDGKGVDRVALHAEINSDITTFFNTTLAVTVP